MHLIKTTTTTRIRLFQVAINTSRRIHLKAADLYAKDPKKKPKMTDSGVKKLVEVIFCEGLKFVIEILN